MQPIRKRPFLIVLVIAWSLVLLGSCDLNLLLKQGSTKKVAILYGISIYVDYGYTPYVNNEGHGNNLTFPDEDVESMASLLTTQGWTVIKRINGPENYTGGASLANLQADVATVTAAMEAGERVLFYYSGHGVTVPANASNPGQWIVPFGGVDAFGNLDYTKMLNPAGMAALFKPLTDRKANLIIMLDSCFSGGFVANGKYSSDLPPDYSSNPYVLGGQALTDSPMLFTSIADFFQGNNQSGALDQPSVWVLSAAGSAESSYDYATVSHGAFTYAVLNAAVRSGSFMNADYNHDGFVTLQELYRSTKETLDQIWNIYATDASGSPSQFLPHLSGNPLDILMFH